MIRVTVDTNIFISATFWRGVPKRVIEVFEAKQALLILSEVILSELERKLHHRKFATELAETGLTVDAIISSIRSMAEMAAPADVPDDAVRDPKDRMILACAVGGGVDMIVSGDKDLTELQQYQSITIVTPAQFIALLNPPAAAGAPSPVSE